MPARPFLRALRSFDLPARLRAFLFSACRLCFSAEAIFAMNSAPSFENLLFGFDAEGFQTLACQRRFRRVRVFVHHVLQLHDALAALTEREIGITLFQQSARDLVGLREFADD